MTRKVEVAIIGAGTAGLNAMGQVRRRTDNFVLINGGELGTTCARVGCMPSKVAIQVADDFHRRRIFEREGIEGGDGLGLDISEAFEHVRDLRDILVDRVLARTTDNLGDEFIDGYARCVAPGVIEVNGERIEADAIIVAAGSRPVVPAAWQALGDRVVTTDTLFEQERWPRSLAVIGLGAVGLEMGQALHRMGVQVTGFDALDTIAGLTDPAVRNTAVELLGKEFPLLLGQPAEVVEQGDQLRVSAGDHSVLVDQVLASMGRRSNLDRLELHNLGLDLDDHGMPAVDPSTMQVDSQRVFIAGDITGERQILHEAGNEGRIAGYNATRAEVTAFARTTPMAVTFSDPNICQVGAAFDELEPGDIVVGEMRFGPLGRALVMGKNRGILRVYVNRADARLLGACMVAPRGENLAHLIAWCLEQGLTVTRMLSMPFYHPTIEEALQGALRDAVGKLEDDLDLPDHPLDIRPL